jgi:hypothetical protein
MRTALSELSEVERFDYVVVNDDLEEALRTVEAIVAAESHRVKRLSPEVRELIRELSESLKGMLDASLPQEARCE